MDFSPGDIEWYMQQLSSAGGNTLEVFLHRSWPQRPTDGHPVGWTSCLYKKAGEWTDPKFPGVEFPLFDLDQWADDNVAKLSTIFRLSHRYGLRVIVRIHDQHSRKTPEYRRCYPFDASLQERDLGAGAPADWLDDEADIDTLGRKHIRWYLRRENDRLLELVRESGADVLFCIMNEADYSAPGNEPDAVQDRRLVSFHEFYYDDLTAKGVPAGRIIICALRALAILRAHPKLKDCIFEFHGCNSPQALQRIIETYGRVRVFPNGDGPDKAALGLAGTIGYSTREPSLGQAREMRAAILSQGLWGWCTWNRNVEQSWPADIRRANFDIIRIMAGWD